MTLNTEILTPATPCCFTAKYRHASIVRAGPLMIIYFRHFYDFKRITLGFVLP